MLELLPRLLLIRIRHRIPIDLRHIREPVDDEGPEEDGVGHFVVLDGEGGEGLQGFEFRDLDEAVDVIILKQQLLQIDKAFQLGDVRRRDDAVEAHVLERNLHHRLLKLLVIQHLQRITVYEQQLVTFDFGVAGLDEAIIS